MEIREYSCGCYDDGEGFGLCHEHSPVIRVQEPEYKPIPPKRSFTVDAMVTFRGRGKPLPFPVEED